MSSPGGRNEVQPDFALAADLGYASQEAAGLRVLEGVREVLAEHDADGAVVVAPNLPPHPVPDGHTEDSWLRELTQTAARRRYGTPADHLKAYQQLERELGIIAELGFAGYFLIVRDLVEFCRERDIYCQGRGSAANSAVCYALGITNCRCTGICCSSASFSGSRNVRYDWYIPLGGRLE